MVTMYDVARVSGLSIGTVSRFVNESGSVSVASRAKIQAAIAETGFVPNSAARSLTTKRSHLVAFLATDLINPFTAHLAQSMAIAARAGGYGVLTAVTGGDEQGVIDTLLALRGQNVDGLVITPPDTRQVRQHLKAIVAAGTPVVYVGMKPEGTGDRVTSDTYSGARAAVAHLIGLGHERIAFATHPPADSYAKGRLAGYTDELAAHGIAFDAELIVAVDPAGHDVIAATRRILDSATAVFTVNDVLALTLIQEAHRLGVHVPTELSVVGFDDIPLARVASPPLTTVAQPTEVMGRQVAELLLSRIEEPDLPIRDVRLGCALIARGSTAPPAHNDVPIEGEVKA